MLSVIICSRNAAMLEKVSSSIAETAGIPIEVIGVDNSAGKYGICEAYNIGAEKAKFDLLCFTHEDIIFKSNEWGQKIADILADKKVGVLGVAGGVFQPKAPAGWMGSGQALYMNILHSVNGITEHDYTNKDKQSLAKVAAVDGVWMCCRREVWQEVKFDSTVIPGFHFYDIDFCARIAKSYTNYVTFDVLIEHFSRGTFDAKWASYAIDFYRKRKDILPFGVINLTEEEEKSINLRAFQYITSLAISLGLPAADVLYCLRNCLRYSLTNRDTLYLVKVFLAKKLTIS